MLQKMKTKTKILLVEDEDDISSSLIFLLEREGYEVALACNGCEALKHLENFSKQPSLILLDVSMPIMGGIEFLEKRKNSLQAFTIPVIVISAISEKVIDKSVFAKFTKPFDFDKLFAEIKSVVAKPHVST